MKFQEFYSMWQYTPFKEAFYKEFNIPFNDNTIIVVDKEQPFWYLRYGAMAIDQPEIAIFCYNFKSTLDELEKLLLL